MIQSRYQQWRTETYPRLAPILVVFCLVIASFASVGVLWLTKVQGDEADRRSEAISGVLDCFDTYASRSSNSSKLVRTASEDVSAATAKEARRSARWTDLLVRGLAFDGDGTSVEAQRIIRDFAIATMNLKVSQTELVKAQRTLAQVRKDNPVPDPPSTFCEVQP